MRTRSRRLLVLGAAAVAVPLLLTPAAPANKSAVTINVTLTDKSIRLSKVKVPADTVTFNVKNAGKAKHSFKILTKKTAVLAPGKSAKLVVKFAKAGKFPYSSTVAGDLKKGLKGVLTVTAPAGGGANLTAGKTVFTTTGCGGCHVLKAAGGVGTVSPNLDTSAIPLSTIVGRVTNGKGAMLAYKDQLTPQQIQDVSNFIFKSRGA
jgi:mono/diheme cytochrome c family protein